MNDQNVDNKPDETGWTDIPKQPTEPVPPVTPSEPIPPVESVAPVDPVPVVVFDPVEDESEPYVNVIKDDGFTTSTVSNGQVNPPAAEKKSNNGWIIALIVVLVLCLCLCVVVFVVGVMVASGEYRIEWSYLLDSAIRALSLV